MPAGRCTPTSRTYAAHLAASLPPETVIDGELVAWETSRDRTSFALLQRRITAGRRLADEIRQYPAHLVIFDLLQDAGVELLPLPLLTRRARLAHLLIDGPPPLPLCPQTRDRDLTLTWFNHGADVGIEDSSSRPSPAPIDLVGPTGSRSGSGPVSKRW